MIDQQDKFCGVYPARAETGAAPRPDDVGRGRHKKESGAQKEKGPALLKPVPPENRLAFRNNLRRRRRGFAFAPIRTVLCVSLSDAEEGQRCCRQQSKCFHGRPLVVTDESVTEGMSLPLVLKGHSGQFN